MGMALKKIREIGQIVEHDFYKNYKNDKSHFEKIRGMFSDIGKKIKSEGKTSVELVRELREVK